MQVITPGKIKINRLHSGQNNTIKTIEGFYGNIYEITFIDNDCDIEYKKLSRYIKGKWVGDEYSSFMLNDLKITV